MRLDSPRLAPLTDAELDTEAEALVAPMRTQGRDYNVFRTLARHPAAMKAFMGFASYILSRENSLPAREREILILRTGFTCGSGYEWSRHVRIAQHAGLTDAEIDAIKRGPGDPWSDADNALLRAADSMVAEHFIDESAWQALARHFSEHQCIDAILTVGQYAMVSTFLNSAGVPLDGDVTLDPELDRR